MKHESERARSVRLFSEHSFHPRLRAALAAAVILAFSTPIFAQAAKNKKPAAPQPKSEREQAKAQVFGRLAQAWTAVFSGKSQEAITLAEPVAKLSDPDYKWAAVEATHIQARAYHQSGTAQGRARAAQLWKQIERLDTSKATKARLQIAKALEAEARGTAIPGLRSLGEAGLPANPAGAPGPKLSGDPSAIKQAIDTLEPLLKAGRWNLVEVEAALDLSRLYVQANRFDDAKKTLDYIVAYLGVRKNLLVLEIPPGLEKPYIAAAQAALAHLKYDKNIGLAEFEAAEKLRKAGKFADAMRAYQAVIAIVKNFPESDYAPRSDLHVGDCLLGLGQTARAIEHWKKFIAPAPAGPWRGQAYIGIIDYCLEEQLDLPEAGKYADLARNSLPAALHSRSPSEASAKEGGEAGWQLAAFDIHLRVGLVSFCQGQTAQSVAAFQAAKAAAANKQVAESLDALIAAAKSGKAVIPEDCAAGTSAAYGGSASAEQSEIRNPKSAIDQPSLALSMGIIHLLAGRYDNADNMFDRVLGSAASPSGISHLKSAIGGQRPPLPGATPAQTAFATFGRGAVLQDQRKSDAAKAQFLASIKAFPAGSWHDETLYRLATITQDQANPSPSKGEVPASAGGGGVAAAAIRNQERLAAFLKAKGAALPYWQEIISRYPKSPRCEQAFYNAGVLLCEIAEISDAPGQSSSESEKKWKDAAFMLGRFCEFYPKNPFAGDAYVREIDIALERMFDLKLAESLADTGSQWIKRWQDTAGRPEAKPEYGPWQVPPSIPDEAAIKFVIYDLRLRGIFAAYLAEKYEKAKQLLAATGPLEPKDGRIDAEKVQKVGLFFLQKAIVAQKPIWNTDVLAKVKTDPQRTALKLADLYLKVVRPDKSAAIYERIIDKDPVFAPALPGLELYACIQLARSYSYDRKDHDKAIGTLQTLYRPEFAKEPQLAEGLVWLGTLTFNFTQDAKKTMPHFEYVLKHFPDSPSAERAMYFFALAAIAGKDKAQAVSACNEFIAKYPKSSWVKNVMSLLNNEVAKLPTRERNSK